MSAPKAINIAYTLHPPAGVPAPDKQLPPTASSSTYTISPPSPPASEAGSATSAYYAALGPALCTAQKEINDTLTAWKDAIGDKEKSKEDPGTIGFGKGKAAMMSEDVRGELRGQAGENEEEEDEDASSEES